LHDARRRPGTGSVDLPIDRRIPWRTHMGFGQRWAGGDVPVRPAAETGGPGVSWVFVVDDDPAVREALDSLFRSVDHKVALFVSAAEFLQHKRTEDPACLVLDIRLPGVSGLDFQDELAKAGIRIPIIFMTGHGDIPMSVRAMKAGAVDFLAKPFRDQDMLDAVAAALRRDQQMREEENAKRTLRDSFDLLTTREREVMALVTSGLMNKQVAGQLGLSEITVKIHRSHAMQKMKAKSL